ncbi:MAG: SpoIIE family protein phosphatase [Clostridia bacterium]
MAERKKRSLSTKVFRMFLLGTVVLGLILAVIGLALYSISVGGQYISTSFNLSRSASMVLQEAEDPEPLYHEVMGRYRALTEDERAGVETEEYEARFADITDREDYRKIRTTLGHFLESSDVYDIYLAMYDEENNALVYIVDPSEEDVAQPGYWEEVPAAETAKFLHWNGQGMLYDISRMEKYGWICTAGVPLKNQAGETTGFILADITLTGLAGKLNNFALQYFIAMAILIPLFGWFMTRRTKKMMVEPINAIAKAAQTYVQDKQDGIRTEGQFESLGIRTGDEIENLASSMAEMEKDLTEYEDNLTRVTAEKQRIGTELALATRIQADMLPNIFPAFPERQEFSIYASMTPAKEVGGDFYDFFFVEQDVLAMVIADVSGKGIPAAMFMMMAKSMIQTQAASGRSPAEVLENVNRLICDNNQEGMFVTVWFATLDLKTGLLTAASAGHEYPILKTPEGAFEIYRDPHGFVIGGMPGLKFREYEIRMEPGSKLFVYTDGVAEATNAENELFGMERTVDALNEAMDKGSEEILRSVNNAVERFVGDAEQFDDLTMMCVEFRGKEGS